MTSKTIRYIGSILLLNLSQLSSYGHSVYFDENKNSEIKLRFGEFQDEYEESPGYLDSLDAINAWKINDKNEPEKLDAEKQKNGFSLTAKNSDNIATLLRTLKKEVQKNSTFVGYEFVSKVRSMKEGKIKEKPIHGQGTNKEIQELRDEGIDVVNIPWISDDH